MAATRLIALHQHKGRTVAQSLGERTDYAKNPEKTEKGETVTSFGCDPYTVDEEFMLQKRQYYQTTGKKQHSDVIAYQIRQSFKPGEITAEEANRVGYELALRFTKGKYSFIVATHTDRAHIHNHIVFNSTSMDGTKKFKDFWRSGLALQKLSDLICLEHGLSVIEQKPYDEREKRTAFPKKTSARDAICQQIDEILARKPKDFPAFLDEMKKAGYEIKTGANVAVKSSGQKRFIRLSSLPDGYKEADIMAVLSGKVKLQSRTATRTEDQKIRGLSHLSSLVEEKTKARDDLLDSIKASESRLAEIATLKKHIINYSKTRSTYEEYRKAGYSKKFLEAHREEITLHKAAKQAFDELGVKRLPKVKDLNAEYAELFSGKKAAYAEYRRLRDEAQELAIAESNLSSLFESEKEEQSRQKEKEH